jgi:predicted AAA+ superfamily ATPase
MSQPKQSSALKKKRNVNQDVDTKDSSSNHKVKANGHSKKKLEQRPQLPVTLISGFLGSGKTSLLKSILENKEKKKIAVIVNDMAAINIDAELIKKTNLVQVKQVAIYLMNLIF